MAEENNNNNAATDKAETLPIPVAEQASKASEVNPDRGKPLALIALILSLCVLVLLSVIAFHLFQRGHAANRDIAALQQQSAEQQVALQQLPPLLQMPKAFDQTKAALEHQLNEQHGEIKRLGKALLDLGGRHPSDWLLAEANYLVHLAGNKLWLEHDLTSALLLLNQADQLLAELNDPSLTPIRAALATDIATLQALPNPDLTNLALRLSALAEKINVLKLKGIVLPEIAEPERNIKLTNDPNDWLTNLAKTWRSFVDDFITIRQRNADVDALLPPDQRWYLQENLRNRLQLAQLALFRQQQVVYQNALNDASIWLEDYFQTDHPQGQAMLKQLSLLKGELIAPQYPADLTVRKPLQHALDQRLKRLFDGSTNKSAAQPATPQTGNQAEKVAPASSTTNSKENGSADTSKSPKAAKEEANIL